MALKDEAFISKYKNLGQQEISELLKKESPETLKEFYLRYIETGKETQQRSALYFSFTNNRVQIAKVIIELNEDHLRVATKTNDQNLKRLEQEQLKLLEQQEVFKQKIIANIQKIQLQMDVAYTEELIRSYQIQIKELRNLLREI